MDIGNTIKWWDCMDICETMMRLWSETAGGIQDWESVRTHRLWVLRLAPQTPEGHPEPLLVETTRLREAFSGFLERLQTMKAKNWSWDDTGAAFAWGRTQRLVGSARNGEGGLHDVLFWVPGSSRLRNTNLCIFVFGGGGGGGRSSLAMILAAVGGVGERGTEKQLPEGQVGNSDISFTQWLKFQVFQ